MEHTMAYVTRTIENSMRAAGDSFPCIAVYGPRQVGKSTTIDHLFGGAMRAVTLDDAEDRILARQNPKLFLEGYGWPLIIDEVQKAPELLDEIKIAIDRQRLDWLKNGSERRLMYVLTGSSRFELQQGISDSLAGRCGVLEMSSFSQAEKYGAAGVPFSPSPETLHERERALRGGYRTRTQIFEDIFQGGMPDVCTGAAERSAYYKAYAATYLEKDVRSLIAAGSEAQFRNFLTLAALRTAQELHYDALAAGAGIDVRTCRRWLSILETSGIITLLHPYLPNASNRIIKAPKLYFMDTGLCAWLCKWPDPRMLEQCAMGGAFFETYAVSELIKNLRSHGRDPKEHLFYYRDTDQKEIDMVYAEGNTLYPIEVKTNESPRNPAKHFGALAKYKMPVGTGLVIDTCETVRPVNGSAYFCPVWLLGM